MLELYWPPAPPAWDVPGRAIHIWCIPLDQPGDAGARLAQTLSAEEQQRAARFYFPQDRRHFMVGRGWLRTLLARYLGCPPPAVPLVYGPSGKPALAGAGNPLGIEFNLAHSQGLALLAITQERQVGIDLEWVRPVPEAEQIARHFFTAREAADLLSQPPTVRQESFFRYWTRKEACLKASGAGLGRPLHEVDVSGEPDQPIRLHIGNQAATAGPGDWVVHDLHPAAGYLAALATEPGHGAISCWRWLA